MTKCNICFVKTNEIGICKTHGQINPICSKCIMPLVLINGKYKNICFICGLRN